MTVLAIGSSVALATALEMSSRSARVQIARTADAMVGAATLEVAAGTLGLPESVLETVRGTRGVATAGPLISATLHLPDHAFPLDVVGIDFLAEQNLRSISVSRQGVRVADPLRLLASAHAAIVSPRLLERLGMPLQWTGSPSAIRVRIGEREETLTVQGTLEPGGIAAAFGGQVVLMDVYALQALVGRQGWIDRVDIVVDQDHELEAVASELRARLHGVATVRRSSIRTREIDDILSTLQIAVSMFSAIAVVVSSLLTYAAMSTFTERQRRTLAVLRSTGMGSRWATGAVVLDTLALSFAGTLLGSIAGFLLSAPMLGFFSTFTTGFRAEEIRQVSLEWSTLGIAAIVGVVAALAGSAGPARRAARRFVLDALASDLATPTRSARRWLAVSPVLAVVVLVGVAQPLGSTVQPTVRLALIFGGALGLVLSLAPGYARALRWMTLPLVRAVPSVGHMACAGFRARPWSLAITLSVLGGIVGALTGIFLVVESLALTFGNYATTRYPDGVLVSAGSLVDQARRDLLTPQTIELIRTTPGVEALAEQYWYRPTLLFRGQEVAVWAVSMDVVATHGFLPAIDRPGNEVALDVSRGAVAVSMAFARRFDVHAGDEIEIDTPQGARAFAVAGTVRDYMGARGSITFDLKTFDAYWHRAGAYQAVLWTKGEKEEVLQEVRRRTAGVQDLFLAYGDELREIHRKRVLRFTGLLDVIAALVAALGGLAVTILLIGSVTQRRQELSLLRAAGAEPAQVITLVIVDAMCVALIGCVLGLALGYASTPALVGVLEVAYGSPIDRSWFAPQLPFVALSTFLVSLLGATLPARIAYQTLPSEALAPE